MYSRNSLYTKIIIVGIIILVSGFVGYILFLRPTIEDTSVAGGTPLCSELAYLECSAQASGDFKCIQADGTGAGCCNSPRKMDRTTNRCVDVNVGEGGSCTPEGVVECASGICCGCNKCLGSNGGSCDQICGNTPPPTPPVQLCGADGYGNCTPRNDGACGERNAGKQRVLCVSNVDNSTVCYERNDDCTITPPLTPNPDPVDPTPTDPNPSGPTQNNTDDGNTNTDENLCESGLFCDRNPISGGSACNQANGLEIFCCPSGQVINTTNTACVDSSDPTAGQGTIAGNFDNTENNNTNNSNNQTSETLPNTAFESKDYYLVIYGFILVLYGTMIGFLIKKLRS